jgi:hypothetical protein
MEFIVAITIVVTIVLIARYADRQHPPSPPRPQHQRQSSQLHAPSTSPGAHEGRQPAAQSQVASPSSPTEVVQSGRLVHTPIRVFKHNPAHRSLPGRPADYKSEYSQHCFSFTFCKIGNKYRAYISKQPAYGQRKTDAHSTHRLTDSSGNRYVCIQPEPTSMDEMLTVTRWWAECTSYYIEHGGGFPEPKTVKSALTRRRRS